MDTHKGYAQCRAGREWNPQRDTTLARTSDTRNAPAWSLGQDGKKRQTKPLNIREVEYASQRRITSGNAEFDRILGGGIVPGSLMLLGGEPGIGKSTLMLQLALRARGVRTLYVSGEESAEQIRMRAERIGIDNEECYILP